MSDRLHWARLLAFVTGLVNQELLLRNEYLTAEYRVLRAHLPRRLRLSDAERSTLAEIAKRLGRKGLKDIARIAKPDTLLGWYRRLVAQKFDGSRHRAYPGRPRVSAAVEALVVQFACENRSWGYDRIVGALANLGHSVSDRTVGNILRRYNLTPAPERSRTTTWKEFIRAHMDVLAGTDFFTVEVLTWRGLVTYYVLFFIEVGSRRVSLGGITRHPDSGWMEQVAQRRDAEHRISERLSLPAARSRQKVLPRVSGNTCRRGCGVYANPGEKTELEHTLGALGAFRQRRMPIEADFVRGCLARGVSCPSICDIIIMRETTKARAMSCSSRHLLRVSRVRKVRLAVENGSSDYSSTTGALHECFGQAASIKRSMSDEFFPYTGLR